MSITYADIYREHKTEGVCAGFLLLAEIRKIGIDYGMLFNGGSWWRHKMETFPALVAFCEGNSPVTDEFLLPRPVTQSFIFFDLRLNKPFSKSSRRRWFATPLRSLLRHCNGWADYTDIDVLIWMSHYIPQKTTDVIIDVLI